MSNALICPVILAGGASSRLWPASGAEKPKWDLRFAGAGQERGQSLLEGAWERARAVAPAERCFVVSGGAQAELAARSLPDLPRENLLIEPEPRDTSGAVAFAAGAILRNVGSDAVMFVLPGDHVISPVGRFTACALAGAKAAVALDAFVTFGIVAREPSTAYGYIRRGDPVESAAGGPDVFKVRAFREKPDRATAESYLASGEYYWNGGIFLWQISTLMRELEAHLPVHAAMARELSTVARGADGNAAWEQLARKYFPQLPKISIDFGIMEKAQTVAAVAADFSWDDIGSWSAVAAHLDNQTGNAREGSTRLLELDAKNNIVFAPGKRVALVGVEGLAVVQSGDDILICRKERDQDVKKISEMAKKG